MNESLEAVAIIGMSGRFPGAKTIDELWNNLANGVESITFFRDEELIKSGISAELIKNPNYIKAKGIIGDTDLFDAEFFGYTPRVAELTDPQHRIFLECAWEAMENAGYDSGKYEGRIGVYAGESMNTYWLNNLYSSIDLVASVDSLQAAIGNDKDSLTTEVAYKMNLNGPAVTIQSSSSTSLVAVHFACQSLLNFECDMALSGGVSIHFPERSGYLYSEGGTTSPDGHCRAFDAEAKGFVSGHGAGVVVLKRLKEAIADRDHIYAVIKATAVNNDGSSKISYMAPSVNGQAEVIALAQALAGVRPEDIGYIEAHGTGTAIGDPIEITALSQVFRARTNKKRFCAIGSIKTNIGHLDTAAGVCGLIKSTLALKNELIPPTLHFKKPNPKIDFDDSPFYVNTVPLEWKKTGSPRRAGISSFGMGGTNAHAILEEAPDIECSSKSRSLQLLMVSAKTEAALETVTYNLTNFLRNNPAVDLADVAYTLQVGRRTFNYKRIIVCSDVDDAVRTLEIQDKAKIFSTYREPWKRMTTFIFSGQGTQHVYMGINLYKNEALFREIVDYCSEKLKYHLGFDLREVLYPEDAKLAEAEEKISQTAVAQTAIFTLEYALARVWIKWGIQPQAMMGHSIGEYTAACISGVFLLDDALALVATRGKLMQQLPGGAMIAVYSAKELVQPLLGDDLSFAAINNQSQCVVSGPFHMIDELQNRLEKMKINFHRLNVSHAFHSKAMDSILNVFVQFLQRISLNPPGIPYISNVTGTWAKSEDVIKPDYWAMHLKQTVLFEAGLAELLREPSCVLLEIGAGNTLSSLAKQHSALKEGQVIFSSLPHLKTQASDYHHILNTLGKLWLAGIEPDWKGFYSNEQRCRIPLPSYPFERRNYWVESGDDIYTEKNKKLVRGKNSIDKWFYVPVWKQSRILHNKEESGLSYVDESWFVFIDEYGIGSSLVDQLRKEGCNVIEVRAGDKYEKINQTSYFIDPSKSSHYRDLVNEFDTFPENIIHLWSISEHSNVFWDDDSMRKSQEKGFYSLLYMAQALGKRKDIKHIQIAVVTNGLYEVTGEEKLHPEKALVLGPCMVIPKEYPNIICGNIDLELSQSDKEINVKQILYEVKKKIEKKAVSYRGTYRWIQTFEKVPVYKNNKLQTILREKGVYIITGGLGGIGFKLAEFFAHSVQAKLILIGRSAFPGREEWKEWINTHGEKDAISNKIKSVQRMEQFGAEVIIMKADVTCSDQMERIKIKLNREFGKIHGIVHAAGVLDEEFIKAKTYENVQKVFEPKVKGVYVIHKVFKDTKLDFFILCSSLSSVLPRFRQVDYCSANAFIDAFSYYASRQGMHTVSINWDTWKDVGMGLDVKAPVALTKLKEEILSSGMSSEEGMEVFSRILCSRAPQVIVSVQDLDSYNEYDTNFHLENSTLDTKSMKTIYERPMLANDYIEPTNKTEKAISEIWKNILGIDKVGIHDNFFDLGGNSLLGVNVINRIKSEMNADVTSISLYEGPTVYELAKIIEQKKVNRFDENINRGEKRREKAITRY